MVDRHKTYYVVRFYGFRNKSEPTFTRWSKGIGKVVIYKALHEGDVKLGVRIAEPLRNEDCSTANLFSLITVPMNEKKVHDGGLVSA